MKSVYYYNHMTVYLLILNKKKKEQSNLLIQTHTSSKDKLNEVTITSVLSVNQDKRQFYKNMTLCFLEADYCDFKRGSRFCHTSGKRYCRSNPSLYVWNWALHDDCKRKKKLLLLKPLYLIFIFNLHFIVLSCFSSMCFFITFTVWT